MTPLEVLKGARELISDRSRWMKGNMARARNDLVCGPDHPEAVRWCALGAIWKVGGRTDDFSTPSYMACAQFSVDHHLPITSINDTGGHEQILAALDVTIARLETEELEAIPVAAGPSRELTPV